MGGYIYKQKVPANVSDFIKLSEADLERRVGFWSHIFPGLLKGDEYPGSSDTILPWASSLAAKCWSASPFSDNRLCFSLTTWCCCNFWDIEAIRSIKKWFLVVVVVDKLFPFFFRSTSNLLLLSCCGFSFLKECFNFLIISERDICTFLLLVLSPLIIKRASSFGGDDDPFFFFFFFLLNIPDSNTFTDLSLVFSSSAAWWFSLIPIKKN